MHNFFFNNEESSSSSSNSSTSASSDSDEHKSTQSKRCRVAYLYRIKDIHYVPRSFEVQDLQTSPFIDPPLLEESFAHCPSELQHRLSFLVRQKTAPVSQTIDSVFNRILLTGNGYNGKTILARALAYKYQASFVYVPSPELCDSYKEGYVDIIDNLMNPLINCQEAATVIVDAIVSFSRRAYNTR